MQKKLFIAVALLLLWAIAAGVSHFLRENENEIVGSPSANYGTTLEDQFPSRLKARDLEPLSVRIVNRSQSLINLPVSELKAEKGSPDKVQQTKGDKWLTYKRVRKDLPEESCQVREGQCIGYMAVVNFTDERYDPIGSILAESLTKKLVARLEKGGGDIDRKSKVVPVYAGIYEGRKVIVRTILTGGTAQVLFVISDIVTI